jgi:hypothetical protein
LNKKKKTKKQAKGDQFGKEINSATQKKRGKKIN